MSTIEKLKKKFYEKPIRNDITYDEVERLARYYGCDIYTGGNHQKRIVHKQSGTIIPLPQHGNLIKEAYIKELRDLFDTIRDSTED